MLIVSEESPARTMGRLFAVASASDPDSFVAGREQVPGALMDSGITPTSEAVEEFCAGWESGGGPVILAALVE